MHTRQNESILRHVTTATVLSLGIGFLATPALAQQAGQADQQQQAQQQQGEQLEQTQRTEGFKPAQAPGEPFYNEAEGSPADDILRGTDVPSDYEPPTDWPNDQTQRQGQQQRTTAGQQADQARQPQQRREALPAPDRMQDRSKLQWQASEQDLDGMFSDNVFVEQDRQWGEMSTADMQRVSGTVVDLETLLVHGKERAVQATGPAASLSPNDPVALIADDGSVYVIIDRYEQQQRQGRQLSQSGQAIQGWPADRQSDVSTYTTGAQRDAQQRTAQRDRTGQLTASPAAQTRADVRSQQHGRQATAQADRQAQAGQSGGVTNIRPTDHGDRVATQFQADMQDRAANADRRTAKDEQGLKQAQASGEPFYNEAEGAEADNILRGTEKPSDYEPAADWPQDDQRQAQQQRGQQDRQTAQAQQRTGQQATQQARHGQAQDQQDRTQQARHGQQNQQGQQQAAVYRQDSRSGQMQKVKDFQPSDLKAGQKVTLFGTVHEYQQMQGIEVEGYRVQQSQPFAESSDKPADRTAMAND